MESNTTHQESLFTKETIITTYTKDGVRLQIIRDNLEEERKKVGEYGKTKKEV